MNLFFIQINVSRPGLGRIFSIINQNKLERQHAVGINTVYNRKEKKNAREEREETERKLKLARAVNQNRRGAKTVITTKSGGVP